MRIPFMALLILILAVPNAANALIARLQVTCVNVDNNISMLEREKGYNGMRVRDGVYTVYPPTPAYQLVEGAMEGGPGESFKMTTSEWDAKLDARIAALNIYKEQCPPEGVYTPPRIER